MYVNLNCFDYNKLLSGIVEHYNLQDDLTDETIAQVFRNLSNLYSSRGDLGITEEEVKMVESFLGLTVSYISFEGEDFIAIQEQIDDGLDSLEAHLTQQVDQVPYGSFIEKWVIGKFLNDVDVESCEYFEQVAHFIECFDNMIHRYITAKSIPDFGPGELFVLGEIEKYTHPCEVVTNINVIDVPGTKVRYGNSLITFPLILVNVTETH
ncbi:hypothetical protein OBP_053 [Pseudomonas phage OBP]|uniref:hypothetical protein n=1 Tax=Pseudomonas phage OBP TaxID=1124849 RepID=UPI000240D632|nr:hypothetical protein OBP_053 [Pseudomonas phage OBP]AEV89490.1 hypothetical protein OBP_053 [Pseudomonas phage OBP]